MEDLEPALLERVRQTTEFLEWIDEERQLLALLPIEDRQRLHRAVAQLHNPDPIARRQKQKAAERARNEAQLQRAETLLQETGIRALRRKPVYTTPNVFPPRNFEPADLHLGSGEDAPAEPVEVQHCYVCKREYTAIHHFYDQLCPKCAEFNFAKRTELADLTGRVALLTGGRVKIGYQAGLKLLRAGAELIVTTRFMRKSRILRSGAIVWRSSDSTCAIRRAWKRFASSYWQRGRAWISSSTMRVRRCGGHPSSIST
jgi:hypothetical protein